MVEIISNAKSIQKINGNNGYTGVPLTETLSNCFFNIDRQGTIKYINKTAEKLFGVSAKLITGKNMWEKLAGIIPPDFYSIVQKTFLHDKPVHFEKYWGEIGDWFDVITYHCDDTLSVSFKSSKQPADTVNSELKILNEMYKFVTEITNDCLWDWGLQSKEIFWIDGGHKRVFGYPIENALVPQIFWESQLHPDDKLRLLTKLNKIISEGPIGKWDEEYRFKRSNGQYAYVHERAHVVYAGNKAIRMIGATEDITGRKMAEIKLLESEKKLSLVAKQTVNALIIADADENIIWVNSAFTSITEYELEEVIGRKQADLLIGKGTDPLTVSYIKKQFANKELFDCDIINYSKSGIKRWIHVQGQPLLDENGICHRFFVIGTDITEKVKLENKLTEERLASQKDITDAVLTAQENERSDIGRELHDNLNQILVATKLYIEMAKTDAPDREKYLDKASGYIVDVIEEIRNISKRLAPPDLNMVGLFDSIKILLSDLNLIHSVKIKFIAHGIAEEELNQKLQINLFRIIQEQMNNIIKHSKATTASIHLTGRQNEIRLLITDNGVGFDTSKRRKGLGIRNIMSRAELCHGKAEIKTTPGEGFQLSVVIPCPGHLGQ